MSPDLFRFFHKNKDEGYVPQLKPTNSETWFNRGHKAFEVLDSIVLSNETKPRILLVGLDLRSAGISCCYEPYRFVAHLENKGADFEMLLLDNDSKVIEDIQTRENLYVPRILVEDTIAEWERYIEQTGHDNSDVTGTERDLYTGPFFYQGQLVGWDPRNLQKAPIPASFTNRLSNGSIQLIHADIAVANLGEKPVNFCKLENVLYLLSPLGQKLALENISRSMKQGGVIVFDDQVKRNIDPDTPLLKRNGGWLGDRELRKLSLDLEILEEEEGYFGLEITGILHKK